MIDITIIDNVLPTSLADAIEKTILAKNFPWYFLNDITWESTDRGDVSVPGHQHIYFDTAQGVVSGFFGHFHSIPMIIFDKIGYKKSPVLLRAKSFMQLPLIREEKYLHNNRHVDFDTPHIACVYYVNDSDGDTFIYDNESKSQRISPKKNRAVVFDGSLYHASSLPTKNKRVIINIDVAYDIVEGC